jgi:NAD(P)-dependent dehydrogenase (short-subunit alcohol dehydrogenase family)
MLEQPRLMDKSVIVTGGASPIGSAIAQLFCDHGASVAIVDADGAGARRVAAGACSAGGRAIAVEAIVSEPESAKQVVAAAIGAHGKLHVLVNGGNAEGGVGKNVLDLDVRDWNQTLSSRLDSAFLMSKFGIPHLRKSQNAAIINIASYRGHLSGLGEMAHNAADAALLHFTRILALDFAKDGIRVNSLSPGEVSVREPDHARNPRGRRTERAALYLSNRLARPEEIAAGALFLASDSCTFMNGADLLIDGGYVAFKGDRPIV